MRKYSKTIHNIPVIFESAFHEKKSSSLTISVSDITYGQAASITVTVPNDATGRVELLIGNEYYSKKTITTQGSVSFSADGLSIGTKNIIANYLGDSEYKSCNNTSSFSVIGIPSIDLSISTDSTTYELGESIIPEVTITNDGDIPLTNVTFYSQVLNQTVNIGTLSPGDDYSVSCNSYNVTETDILARELTCDFVVTGTTPDSTNITVRDSYGYSVEDPNGSISLSMSQDDTVYDVGDEIPGPTVTITNTGNLTLTSINAYSYLNGDNYNGQSLAPGASLVITAEGYTVLEEDILSGLIFDYHVSATSSDPDNPNVGDDTEVYYNLVEPLTELTIEFTEDNNSYSLGDDITPSFTITNTGNLTITEPHIECSLTGDYWVLSSMHPGDSVTRTCGNYTVTQTDINAGNVAVTVECRDLSGDYYTENSYTYTCAQRQYRLTINYYVDGILEQTSTNTYNEGYNYNIRILPREGFRTEDSNGNTIDRITGVLTEDITYNVYYVLDTYILTITYTFNDGRPAASTYTGEYTVGATYNVVSPVIEGYHTNRPTVSGTMPAHSVPVPVIYVPNPNPGGGGLIIE